MSNVLHVKAADFENEVLKNDLPVLVDFWAAWCGPCRMIAPVIDEVADERTEKLKVCKLDVDSEGEVAAKYGVVSIPTLMVFKGGEPKGTLVGASPKPDIDKFIEPFV